MVGRKRPTLNAQRPTPNDVPPVSAQSSKSNLRLHNFPRYSRFDFCFLFSPAIEAD
jgi:hypothetical protein